MKNEIALDHIMASFIEQNSVQWKYQKINDGLINKSYVVQGENLDNPSYVLQRINKEVFDNPEILMSNINYLNDHLVSKKEQNNKYTGYEIIHFNKNLINEKQYIIDQDFYWRLMNFIEHIPVNKGLINLELIAESGKILGLFHAMTADMEVCSLKETISNFHEFDKTFDAFQGIELMDNVRYIESLDFYNELSQFDYLIKSYKELKEQNQLPKRVVHNDPKLSNILFDTNEKALCLIDLDTVMSGYLGNDFGDGVRTICNNNREDEKDLSKVVFSLERFEMYLKAYLNQVNDFITIEERSTLALFCLLITQEQAIRFYSDYLKGDVYYRTSYLTHNLQRAKVQLELLKQMIVQYELMKSKLE